MGGVATGVFRDRAVELPPINERLARRMLESLRFWPLLQGYRGRPGVDLDRLIEVIIRFSLLVADYPEIHEFDINPLLVASDRVVALDAAAILDPAAGQGAGDPYPHLSIRPYPEEYQRRANLADGTAATLRSARPEDEPLWQRLVASSSPQSIRSRFRSLLRQPTHQMAVEQLAIDHERQIAIVAETEVGGERQLIGLAQLLADADHEAAEFALLVSDPWQGKRLGGMLLDYCLELAPAWGIQRVVAETDPDNTRMLDIFLKRGFKAELRSEEAVVLLERPVVAGRDAEPVG
jgi:acetyltransferase